MSNKIIKLAMVGCGEHSHAHAAAIAKIDEIEIASCCDVDKKRSANWARQYACASFYSSLESMVGSEQLDAVILCTWPNQHLEQIKICLSGGIKNILCEKALALTCDEASEIGDLVKSHQAFLMEGMMYRHHPAIQKIEQLIAHSDLGVVDSVRAAFSNYEPETDTADNLDLDWRLRQDCGGGVAYDWMSYCVNACNYFGGGAPERVYATGNVSRKLNVIDRIYGMIEYDNGKVGIIESSKGANFSQMLQVTGAKSILCLPVAWGIYGQVSIEQYRRKPEWGYIVSDKHDIEAANSFYLQLKNFCAVIQKKDKPIVHLDESKLSVSTVQSLVDSVLKKKVVDVRKM